LLAEKGVILAAAGDAAGAQAAWREALAREPLQPQAFVALAGIAAATSDAPATQTLIDRALSAHVAHPDVLRRAIQLALSTEPDGVHRAARVARLARALVEGRNDDPWASLVLAHALGKLGEREAAIARFTEVAHIAPASPMAAEAGRARLALQEPQAALEIEAVLRAAYSAPREDLHTIAARASRLASAHESWVAFFALGVAQRRLASWISARSAFDAALALAPGATPVHVELVGTCVSSGEASRAVAHAEQAMVLEGETSRSFAVLATALLADGRRADAQRAIERSLAFDPNDEAHRALGERIRTEPARMSFMSRLLARVIPKK
jgi:tetratricopeptide (TPR) repeat protein